MAGQRKRGAGDGRTLVRGAYSRCAIPPLRRRAVQSRAYAFRSLCRDIPNRCRGTTMSVSKAQPGGATDRPAGGAARCRANTLSASEVLGLCGRCPGGGGMIFLANDTRVQCEEVAAQLPPTEPSGAKCPVRPPGVDQAIDAVLLAVPDVEDKDFRTLPNSL